MRVRFQGLSNDRALSEPVLRQLPHRADRRGATSASSGAATRRGRAAASTRTSAACASTRRCASAQPDFFIHCGRHDLRRRPDPRRDRLRRRRHGLAQPRDRPEKSKVAETLDEFRGNYRYNLLDENVRRFNAEVPQIWQWDDHEVTNNWSTAQGPVGRRRYTREERAAAGRARRRARSSSTRRCGCTGDDEQRARLPPASPTARSLDVFVIDMRSYRGPNTRQPADRARPRDARSSARAQLQWLKQALQAIARDLEGDRLRHADRADRGRRHGRRRAARAARRSPTANGPPLGRELEIAELLRFIKRQRIRNVVWLTADVHYTAAHHYDPSRAQFRTSSRSGSSSPARSTPAASARTRSTTPSARRWCSRRRRRPANYSPLGGLPVLRPGRHRGATRDLHGVAGRYRRTDAVFSQNLAPRP